jgi:gamma-glutamyltranspeptidase/glutathione hydrolase
MIRVYFSHLQHASLRFNASQKSNNLMKFSPCHKEGFARLHLFSSACIVTFSTLIFILSFHSVAQQTVVLEDREPEAATGINEKSFDDAEEFMVAAANPYAAWAGKNIIEKGGSAIDAAVAVQAMLTLVEPQSSGIGGGAFIMYWDNTEKKLYTFDGRETAPKSANPYIFLESGEPMSWRDAVVGGKSVGVPGVLKALDVAHKKFGQLEWKDLFEDTIKQSRDGFIVSPRLARLLELDLHPGLNKFPASANYFKPEGKPLEDGALKRNPLLATTLQKIALGGVEAFYQGSIADNIAKAVRTVTVNPGGMQAKDINEYQAVQRQAMCNNYHDSRICGMAPPSSGGVTVYQIIKTLERFNLSQYQPDSPEFVHLFSQASALAFADRAHYVADLDFLDLSAVPLVSPSYLRERSKLIGLDKPFEKAEEGMPFLSAQYGEDDAYELTSTSHISIVDKQGNAVSMTSSIEFMFGSGIMVEGFLLNNQLTDFAINPTRDNKLVLNRAQGGKRPRSSMSPTMVFDKDNNLKLVIGSPGGSRIINYVAQTIINVLDFDMDVQSAISFPRITNRNDVTSLEKGTPIASIQSALEKKGHTVRVVDLNSGLHGIQITEGKLVGGADPRREGVAVGQ